MMRVRTGNRELMREVNSKLILGLMRDSETISQVEIVRRTHLSAGTVANIIKELKEHDFVRDVGPGRSSLGGRRPMLMRFNQEARYVVAVELTADRTTLAIMDMMGKIINKTDHQTNAGNGSYAAMTKLCGEIDILVRQARVRSEKILGVGVAIEGVVDMKQERLVLSSNLGWQDVPIKAIMEKELGFKVLVNSSARAMVFGEYLYGVGRKSDSVVCLDVDSGVGCVAILNGQILRGAHNMAGEIGHSRAVPDGSDCTCGKKGCLETVASAGAIISKVKKLLEQGRESSLSGSALSCPAPEAIRLICQAAEQGDSLAGEVINHAGYHLGLAVAAVVNFIDPELVILTGFVTYQSQGLLLKIIRQVVSEQILQDVSRTVIVKEGTLGQDAAIIGAGASACEGTFRVPIRQPRA